MHTIHADMEGICISKLVLCILFTMLIRKSQINSLTVSTGMQCYARHTENQYYKAARILGLYNFTIQIVESDTEFMNFVLTLCV